MGESSVASQLRQRDGASRSRRGARTDVAAVARAWPEPAESRRPDPERGGGQENLAQEAHEPADEGGHREHEQRRDHDR